MLSEQLDDLGFRMVLGKTETVGIEEAEVHKGTPFTQNNNNSVVVVCDEEGRPWIKPRGVLMPGLDQTAYVPFSNDGGRGILQMFPNAFRNP